MAAYELLLLNTAIPQIQAAQSGDTYVVPRDIAFSAALTLSAGTANGVPYLNASKVLTSGSALTFDGTTFIATGAARIKAVSSGDQLRIEPQAANSGVDILSRNSADNDLKPLNIYGSTQTWFVSGGARAMDLTSTGLGIGITNPGSKLDVNGNGFVRGDLGVYSGTGGAVNSTKINFGSASLINAAAIYSKTDTATAGNLVFATAQSGTGTMTERGRFTSDGNLGVGTDNPVAKLDVYKTATVSTTDPVAANVPSIQARATTVSGKAMLQLTALSAGAAVAPAYIETGAVADYRSYMNLVYSADGSGAGYFAVSQFSPAGSSTTERMRITSVGNVKFGGTADRATTVGTNHIDIFNGTAPVGTLTNGISIYSSAGEAYVMDAAGNATLFSPHDAETNEWIFKSKHTPTGKVLKIDVERLLKFVNDHFGLDAVHEFVEE